MSSTKTHVSVVLLYSFITCLVTLPVIAQMGHAVPGQGGDVWQTLWRFETKADSAGSSVNTSQFSSYIATEFLGAGEPRLVNLSVWPWMPLYVIFGAPIAYTLSWLLSFVLAGYGMFLFVHELTRGRTEGPDDMVTALAPPFLAGLFYMMLPYHVAHAQGHFGAMHIEFIPLIAFFVVRWRRTSKAWFVIAASGLFVIQGWMEHHFALFLVLWGVVVAIVYWSDVKQALARAVRDTRLAVGVGVLALLMVLSLSPTVRLAASGASSLALGEEQLTRFSADLFSYVTPAPFHTFLYPITGVIHTNMFTGNPTEATQYLGIVPLLIIVFFHTSIPARHKRLWIITAAVFLIISLGPTLHVLGQVTPAPLPYALVSDVPIFSSIRAIARAGVMVGFSVAVLFGLVLARNIHRRSSAYIVAAVILLEFLFIPTQTQSVGLSPAYDEVAQSPGGTVIEIPGATNYVTASKGLYASTMHGKKVLANIALERAQADDSEQTFIKLLPGIRQLLYVRTTDIRERRTEFFDQDTAQSLVETMRYMDADAIHIHIDSLSKFQTSTIRGWLEDTIGLMPVRYDDDIVYHISDATVQPDGVFLVRGDGFVNVGYDPQRDSVFAEVPGQATVSLFNITESTKEISISYTTPPESRGELSVAFDELQLTAEAQGMYTISLPPGRHDLIFSNIKDDTAIMQNPTLTVH